MSYVKDWTTWAGDHPQEAEAELRKAKTWGAGVIVEDEPTTCEVEGHEFHVGVCLICEEVDDDYDPTPQGEELVTDHADSSDYAGRVAA
jgi:hypothetical protein